MNTETTSDITEALQKAKQRLEELLGPDPSNDDFLLLGHIEYAIEELTGVNSEEEGI